MSMGTEEAAAGRVEIFGEGMGIVALKKGKNAMVGAQMVRAGGRMECL